NGTKNCDYFDECFYFDDQKPILYSLDSNSKVLQVFIINLETFCLNFSNEEEIQENQQHNIYININLVNYKEFLYLYNTVMCLPFLIENVNENRYQLMVKICDILKIKTNKRFEEFIRLMLVSLIFNPEATNKWKFISTSKNYQCSSIVSKKIIVEYFKMHFISEKTQKNLKDNSRALYLTDGFSFDFIKLTDDFLYLDDDIINEILEKVKKSNDDLKIFDYIFCIHKFNCIFLSEISYADGYDQLFNLSLFKNLNEIFINRCQNADLLIQKIYNSCGSGCIKTLNIIHSDFTMKFEIPWLVKLDFEAVNYIVGKDGHIAIFYNSDASPLVQNIFSRFIDEIYEENKSNIFVRTGEVSCYDQDKKFFVQFYQERSKLENFTNTKSSIQTYIYTELINAFLSFIFYIINFSELKNIKIHLSNTCIKDFNIRESEILNNITKMTIVDSTFDAIFLSKILMLPSLKDVYFNRCCVKFLKNDVDFNVNKTIEKLYLGNFSVDDQYHYVKFINHILNLKILDINIYSSSRNSNIFSIKTDTINIKLFHLRSLKYSATSFSDYAEPIFPKLPYILQIELGSNFPKGTLHRIFYRNYFGSLKRLKFDRANLGKEDEFAFGNYINLLSLCFSRNSKCLEINFCKLFNSNNIYSLQELKLPDIEITCLDLQFLSKLNCLKKIYIYSLASQAHIINFFKLLLFVQEIEIEKLSVYGNEIYEQFGTKPAHLIWMNDYENLKYLSRCYSSQPARFCTPSSCPDSSACRPANTMENRNAPAIPEGNRLMQEWPRSTISAVQKRFERMPRNSWPVTLRYYTEKFGCTLDIDAFKKLAQNEAEREIRQEENGERRRIATCLNEPCTLTDTTEYINLRDKFLMVVRTRKLSSELVDSKLLDLINRIIGEYPEFHVPKNVNDASRIIQAAQENIESKISKLVLSKDLLEKARKQEKLSTSEKKSLKKIMPEFNLNLSSVTDLSEALVEKNECLNVYEKKITM
ncbi:hypothetical protein CWI36_1626p0010, partial [Hamiltosporidium magnivora]